MRTLNITWDKKRGTKLSLKALVFTGMAAAVLSACTTHQPSFAPTVLRNKITVAETVERLELYAGQAGLHLSARDQDAVGQFLGQYAQHGEGALYVNVPSGMVGGQGVAQAQSLVQSYLGQLGLSGAAVQSGQYPSIPGAPAPVIVSYRRLATAPIDCSQGANLTATANNQPYGNFGCAQTANLAALIDNPRQLLAPYTMEPGSTVRRMSVIDAYDKAEETFTGRPIDQNLQTGENR